MRLPYEQMNDDDRATFWANEACGHLWTGNGLKPLCDAIAQRVKAAYRRGLEDARNEKKDDDV